MLVVVCAGCGLLLGGGLTGLLYGPQIWIGTSMPLLGQATSSAVAQLLWEQRDVLLQAGRFEGRQLPVTILFTDTADFTTVSEGLAPAALMAWLNRFMAVFGAPLSTDPAVDARAAKEAALEIRRGLIELNASLKQEQLPLMRVRIGIHSGEVLAGSMGRSERLEYAVIGDAVNCASRLESLDKHRYTGMTRTLVSSSTRALLGAELDVQLQ